jgi:hypothetical protein
MGVMRTYENIVVKTWHKRLRLSFFIALVIAFVGLSMAKADEAKVPVMFVQTAQGLTADANTLRLVNVGEQTLYFSDRPVRLAGHLTMPVYLDEWKAGNGRNDFSKDPPNATLSVYQPGRDDNALTVVTISKPVIEGKDLVYSYKLIEGEMPKTGKAIALFIDWVAVGGGFGPRFYGPGFHGGVGYVGPRGAAYIGPRAVIWR